jgi:hypothetical protein
MMRIIRDFNDYYDSSAGYGVDMSIVYHRASKTFIKEKGEPEPQLVSDVKKLIARYNDQATLIESNTYQPFYVGFCGKLYMGLFAYVDQVGKLISRYRTHETKDLAKPEFYWHQKDFDETHLRPRLTHKRFGISLRPRSLRLRTGSRPTGGLSRLKRLISLLRTSWSVFAL